MITDYLTEAQLAIAPTKNWRFSVPQTHFPLRREKLWLIKHWFTASISYLRVGENCQLLEAASCIGKSMTIDLATIKPTEKRTEMPTAHLNFPNILIAIEADPPQNQKAFPVSREAIFLLMH